MKIYLIIALLFLSGGTLGVIIINQTPTPLPTPTHVTTPVVTAVAAPKLAPIAADIVTDVNNERVKAGLAPLVDDPLLDASAAAKCADMVARDYWSHNTPDGAEPWTFMIAQGITYRTAGENLEYGISDASIIVNRWMHSPGHRANILNTTYTHEGLAVCHSDNYQAAGSKYIVVQHFDLPQ